MARAAIPARAAGPRQAGERGIVQRTKIAGALAALLEKLGSNAKAAAGGH
jgi:hypothetical protein